MSRAYPRLPVAKWPDDPEAESIDCRRCDRPYRVVAVNPSDPVARCGRDRCPHCGESRPIPDALHPLYTQWFGLVSQATRRAVRCGLPEDVAEDVAHRAYAEAVLRWSPELSAFSTFATGHIRGRLGEEMARRKKWPSVGGPLPRGLAAADETEDAEDRDHTAAVAEAFLTVLTEREAYVVRAWFGIGRPAAAFAEIGREMGLSAEWVRQIKIAAMTKLQHSKED
jgi:RNA polymerase sigma factor (sigma-70 family)